MDNYTSLREIEIMDSRQSVEVFCWRRRHEIKIIGGCSKGKSHSSNIFSKDMLMTMHLLKYGDIQLALQYEKSQQQNQYQLNVKNVIQDISY